MKYRIIGLFLLLGVGNGLGQQFIGPHGYLTFEAKMSNSGASDANVTFNLHHFNILGDYLLSSRARVFGEMEWEHGFELEQDENQGNADGFVRLERAWFEYVFSNKFKLRFGKFLTPYGIFNQVHDAAPAFDTSILPLSIYGIHETFQGNQQRLYAKFSIGVFALGRYELDNIAFEYKAVISNGRGVMPFEQDDNKDKGIGLCLLADLPGKGLKLGLSFYSDKNGLVQNARQTSGACDLRFEHKGWRFTAELAHSVLDGTPTKAATEITNGGYVEVAYLLFKVQTLLARYDLFDSNRWHPGIVARDMTIGTNVRPMRQVLIKAEVHFLENQSVPTQNYVFGIASLAVVF